MNEAKRMYPRSSIPHSIAQNAIEWGTQELCGPPALRTTQTISYASIPPLIDLESWWIG